VPSHAILSRSLSLVGPGRAGRAFARSWTRAGGEIASVVVRGVSRSLPHELSGAARFDLDGQTLPETELLVVAVPDDEIAAVSQSLAGRLRCRFVFHLSGALPSAILRPFGLQGASPASLHPLRPFTGAPEEDWSGVFVAVEGGDEAADVGSELALAVGARPHRLEASAKPLYHAAASLAAGGVAAVVSVAVRGWAAAGIPEEIGREALAGLAASAASAAADQPFALALTGAVARRDVGTVRSHAAALAGHRDALELYRALAEEILSRTAGRGKEEEIRRVLRDEEIRGAAPRPGTS
jgi:predicted short-subunit dehydrogenase-like oxidoreductase (DUF2520 family)